MPSENHRLEPVGSGEIQWLPAEQTEITEDRRGRLVLTVGGRRHEDVVPAKLFALSDPDRFVAFRDAEGDEIGILEDPGRLPPASRATLTRRLERQYFIPVIREVLAISEYWMDQTWTVQTDRGPRQFTIQGRDSIRFLSDRSLLLMDMDDNHYLLKDRNGLDPASKRWVDRFVW